MKYHITLNGKTSICGTVNDRPDTFLYTLDQFKAHYAKEHECKKCVKQLNDALKKN